MDFFAVVPGIAKMNHLLSRPPVARLGSQAAALTGFLSAPNFLPAHRQFYKKTKEIISGLAASIFGNFFKMEQ
jgi:hypothetical protein